MKNLQTFNEFINEAKATDNDFSELGRKITDLDPAIVINAFGAPGWDRSMVVYAGKGENSKDLAKEIVKLAKDIKVSDIKIKGAGTIIEIKK